MLRHIVISACIFQQVYIEVFAVELVEDPALQGPAGPLMGAGRLVAKRRDGWACTGNQKLEQETTEGTHA